MTLRGDVMHYSNYQYIQTIDVRQNLLILYAIYHKWNSCWDIKGNKYGCCVQNYIPQKAKCLSFCYNWNSCWVIKGNNDGYCLQIDNTFANCLLNDYIRAVYMVIKDTNKKNTKRCNMRVKHLLYVGLYILIVHAKVWILFVKFCDVNLPSYVFKLFLMEICFIKLSEMPQTIVISTRNCLSALQ